MSTLTTEQTEQMIERGITHAQELGVNVSIAIVDAGAHLKTFQRMDGAAPGTADVAYKKARTSAVFPMDSGDFGQVIREAKLMGMENTNGGLAPFPGGVPIQAGDDVIGAVGVSGASAEQDRAVARRAIGLAD